MLWVAYQLFRDIISHYLLFRLNDSPCKSRGAEAEPWMNNFQTHMEPPGWSSRSTIRMLWAQTLMERNLLCSPRVLCCVYCQQLEAQPGVWRNPVPLCRELCEQVLAAFSWLQTHVSPVQGGRVSWQWAGDDLGGFGHRTQHCPCSSLHSPGFFSAWEAGDVCCVPYAVFQQEVVHERATSLVTVVALNREWLIFHGYFSVRHDSWENASDRLAGENEPALLSFKWKCSQALHANIPALDESSLSAWLMLDCQYVSAKVCTAVLETSLFLISLASFLALCLCLLHLQSRF